MSVSRRNFLVAGQALLAAAAFPRKFFGAAATLDAASLLSWTKETFQPLVNSSFAVRTGPLVATWLTLLSVEDMNPKHPSQTAPVGSGTKVPKTPPPVVDTFALHFHGTGEKLQQETYELEHPSLGRFSLFIVPSGATTYTAIISHVESSALRQIPKPSPRRAGVSAASETL